jgi:hypothetical protein
VTATCFGESLLADEDDVILWKSLLNENPSGSGSGEIGSEINWGDVGGEVVCELGDNVGDNDDDGVDNVYGVDGEDGNGGDAGVDGRVGDVGDVSFLLGINSFFVNKRFLGCTSAPSSRK